MNITIIINSKKFPSHLEKKKIMNEAFWEHQVSIVDMASPKQLHELYYDVTATNPELLVTFDFAGFELRTELHTPSLFKIYCRGAHFLFSKLETYDSVLNEQFYLGHFVFVPKGESGTYPNIPDWGSTPDFNKEALCDWLETFKEEAML